MTARQAQNIWDGWRAEHPPDPAKAEDELSDEIAFLDAAIEDYAEFAMTARNEAVRLGAMKAKVEAQARRLELKRATGRLPWDIRTAETPD